MFKKDPLLTKSVSPHSPHMIIPDLIHKNATVLDVGCNTGFLGKTLEEKGVVIDGIDINDEALKRAKKWYRHLWKRDLYTGELSIPKGTYDYIIFADVLEHLPRPDLILQDCHKYLSKNGVIIASLPNIARFEIRLQLLMGRFDYTYGGILSEDHLRFFTKSSAMSLFEKSGYKIHNVIPTGLGHKLNFMPTLTAFQFIYLCKQR